MATPASPPIPLKSDAVWPAPTERNSLTRASLAGMADRRVSAGFRRCPTERPPCPLRVACSAGILWARGAPSNEHRPWVSRRIDALRSHAKNGTRAMLEIKMDPSDDDFDALAC